MSIYAPEDTRAALGENADRCDSRSLFFDRFANPLLKDEPRKNWFSRGCKISVPREATSAGGSPRIPSTAQALFARLQSRLMVNMAGGVMENAGLCLDRYGLPVIPGSAVKGCARRMALLALHDWIEAKSDRPAAADACAPCCEGFSKPAAMLAAIARIFGWIGKDWSDPSDKSDFAWATGSNNDILAAARSLNPPHGTFSGTIAFLAASPNRDPGLELDVVTPHHTKYYAGELSTATDTEDPVPVIFPAVAPQNEGDYFTFPLIPLRLAADGDLAHARRWLAHGLELFGIGAKSNAGYGWFDASEAFQKEVLAKQKSDSERRQKEQAERLEAEKQQAQAQAKADAKAALENALAGLTPEQQEDKKIELLTSQQFDSKLRAFCKEPKKGGPSEAEKQAIVRALRGPRVDVWQAFKPKATKGELAAIEQAIRALCKTMNLGKMP